MSSAQEGEETDLGSHSWPLAQVRGKNEITEKRRLRCWQTGIGKVVHMSFEITMNLENVTENKNL